MDCETIRERLLEYAEGDLSIREAVAIRSHLNHCYTCQEEFDEIRAVLDACRATLKHPNPVNGFVELRERIASEEKPVTVYMARPRVRRLGYALATAAALAMVFWTSAPTVRAARAFLAPLRPDSAAFEEWAQSKDSVAPVVARNFIDRRMKIEDVLDKEGAVSEPTRLAQQPAETGSTATEPAAQPAGKSRGDEDACLRPAAVRRVPVHA